MVDFEEEICPLEVEVEEDWGDKQVEDIEIAEELVAEEDVVLLRRIDFGTFFALVRVSASLALELDYHEAAAAVVVVVVVVVVTVAAFVVVVVVVVAVAVVVVAFPFSAFAVVACVVFSAAVLQALASNSFPALQLQLHPTLR